MGKMLNERRVQNSEGNAEIGCVMSGSVLMVVMAL